MRAGLGIGCLFAVLLLLPSCMALRTREFAANRAGAAAAIDLALKQPASIASVNFTLKKEPADTPAFVWKRGVEVLPNEQVTAVVRLRFDKTGQPTGEIVNLPGNREALAEVLRAVPREASIDRVIARVDGTGMTVSEPFAWAWLSTSPAGVALFDEGVCMGDDHCVDYSAIRTVWASGDDRQSGPYPPTREGLMAAKADPIAHDKRFGRVVVEAVRPSFRIWKPVNLYTVSVLEDERVCGQALEFPLAMVERCYAYAQIDKFSVSDETTTLADALTDTVTFPFRLVGAAAATAAMGAH